MENLNSKIDHTNLSPDADRDEIKKLCREAIDYSFRGVCVNPLWVPTASEILGDSGIKVISVCDFPLGSSFTEVRVREAELACEMGADEVDVVAQLSRFKSGDFDPVREDIKSIVDAIKGRGLLKVIIEAPLLSVEEIKTLSGIVEESGAYMVKTGTGKSGPATLEQVRTISENTDLPVKAAGGIRDRKSAVEFLRAGASVLGTSSGVKIVRGD